MADNQLLNGVDGDDDVFVYTGGERVPRDVRRLRIAENVDTIPAMTFSQCRQLREVEGHNKMKKIEEYAFFGCPSLRRVRNMQGVIEIEDCAFNSCTALSDIDFDKLEIIGRLAFLDCNSLKPINMPSVRSVGACAFMHCRALTDAVFGEKLDRIERSAFSGSALRRIAIPLKDNLFIYYNAFSQCGNLSAVDTLDGGMHRTISSLHLESWRDEMKEEISIDRINQTLLNTTDKTAAIQEWIRRVLSRMEHYRNEHHMLVKEAMTLLVLAVWKANLRENEAGYATQEGVRVLRGERKRKRNDRYITSGASIVIKNVLPFLALE